MEKPKSLNVYYQSIKQVFKVYDHTSESKIKETIKNSFNIDTNASNIFFLDEDGDILILPDCIPDKLSVHLHVRYPIIAEPKKSIEKGLLPGFYWKSSSNGDFIRDNGSTLFVEQDQYTNPGVYSSTSYTSGKLFCTFRTDASGPYMSFGILESKKAKVKDVAYMHNNMGIYSTGYANGFDLKNSTCDFALYLDMDDHSAYFYVKNEHSKYSLFACVEDIPQKIKIFAWIKSRFMSGTTGLKILNGGSESIPSDLPITKINPMKYSNSLNFKCHVDLPKIP